jgi:hypothetical protein
LAPLPGIFGCVEACWILDLIFDFFCCVIPFSCFVDKFLVVLSAEDLDRFLVVLNLFDFGFNSLCFTLCFAVY